MVMLKFMLSSTEATVLSNVLTNHYPMFYKLKLFFEVVRSH